jgi:hypothetical protein
MVFYRVTQHCAVAKKNNYFNTSTLLFTGIVRAGKKIGNPVTQYILGMRCSCLVTGFITSFRNKFPGLFQESE